MTRQFTRGQKSRLSDLTAETSLRVGLAVDAPGESEIDVSCFGLDGAGRLSDDRYFIFYNQPSSPEGAIRKTGGRDGDREAFDIDLSRVPDNIHRLVFTITIDGAGTMRQVRSGHLRVVAGGELLRFPFTGADFGDEKALMVGELYRKDGWRFAAVGQGFDGGLAALLKHFGGEVADEAPAPPPPSPPPASPPGRLSLDKKIEEKAPQLVSLAKKAQITLEKKGLGGHRAKVALVLDISASMSSLYRSGKIQRLAEKVLALSTRIDDDGSIDVFLFGKDAHDIGEMTLDNFRDFVQGALRTRPLEGGTYYGKAMKLVREHYFPSIGSRDLSAPAPGPLPIYVMFLTDGQTFDEKVTEQQLRASAFQPIFWQFMGIGKSKKDVRRRGGGFFARLAASDFSFLEKLDDLPGRYVDNADFFSVEDPEAVSDDELYDLLMTEYPKWAAEAPAKGLVR